MFSKRHDDFYFLHTNEKTEPEWLNTLTFKFYIEGNASIYNIIEKKKKERKSKMIKYTESGRIGFFSIRLSQFFIKRFNKELPKWVLINRGYIDGCKSPKRLVEANR